MKKISKIVLASSVFLALFTGCGGSSSSASLFESDAKPASVDIDTGKKLTKNILANRNTNNLSSNSLNSEETNFVQKGLAHFIQNKKNIRSLSKQSREAVNNTDVCNNGGTVHYSGSGDDFSGGVITVNFQECKMEGYTFNGTMKMDIKLSNERPVSLYMTFPEDLEMKDNLHDMTIYKNSSIKMDNFGYDYNSLDLTNNIKAKFDDTLTGSENSKWHINQDAIYQISGKEYLDSLEQYVTYDSSYDMSKTPYKIGYNGTIISGEAHYIGANNGKIVIKADNGEITIMTDSDNDGVFESSETLSQKDIL